MASTRDNALDLMAKKLGHCRSNFGKEYLEYYREFFDLRALNSKNSEFVVFNS